MITLKSNKINKNKTCIIWALNEPADKIIYIYSTNKVQIRRTSGHVGMSLSTFVENEVQIFLDWFSSTALQCTFRQNVGFIRSNLLEFVTDKLTQRVRPSTNLKNVKNAKN